MVIPYSVVVVQSSVGEMLRRTTDEIQVAASCALAPPVQLFDVSEAKRREPALEAEWHEPLEAVSEPRVEFANCFYVEVVVVAVADDHCVDVR